MKHSTLRSTLILIGISLSACLNAQAQTPALESESQEVPSEVVIQSSGNELKFVQTEVTLKTGTTVHLVFENQATVMGMSHNVVFLSNEEAIDRVGVAAIAAAETEYIPEDEDILFHTPLAAPSETVEVTFTAPSPGTYYYTCTFPGHYVLMRGVLNVTD